MSIGVFQAFSLILMVLDKITDNSPTRYEVVR